MVLGDWLHQETYLSHFRVIILDQWAENESTVLTGLIEFDHYAAVR